MKTQVTDEMVSRFLSWKIPADFSPDCYISFNPGHALPSSALWPVGTNLLTAEQARKMLEHVISEPASLQPHQQRVVEEKTELDVKANALSQFIGHSPIFEKLDPSEQERLKSQNDVMWQYSEILSARIAAF